MTEVHEEGVEITTESFTKLIDQVVRVFDYLGTVLHFAKSDMLTKNESLKAVQGKHKLLIDVVQADKAAGCATVKDSCARNLHRLVCVVTFMRVLLEKLAEGEGVSVKDAATAAYEASLAPIHTYVVRTAVWAGMYVLPSRASFMEQIGETEASARDMALRFLACSKEVERAVHHLFAGIDMPASTPSSNILSGLWGGGSTATAAT